VIGELQGLQNSRLRLFGDDLLNFWLASIDLLRQWKFNEELVRLLDLASDTRFAASMPRIGPPDAGLIRLALQCGGALITEDQRTLAFEAWPQTWSVSCFRSYSLRFFERLPPDTGDTNFMTAVGETRVLPEDLEVTWERLRRVFS